MPADGAPYYCVYGGMIQGIWKRYWNIQLIKGISDPNLQFCKAYSWDEARYVRAASRSFRDILYSKHGWPLLYGTLMEVFGDESAFVIGPGLLKDLCALDIASSSLLRVIALASVSPPNLGNLQPEPQIPPPPHPSPAAATSGELEEQQQLEMYRQNAIDMDVRMRMIVLDYAVQERMSDLGARHEAQVLSRMIDRLNDRVSNLHIDSENLADA
ncbi:hypothetical protein FRC09_010855 [Ceratobasidium sp. 395]|nr:hypothetical protein FRC09_010855 [Ceratobasidium sp. 395]